MSLNPHQLDYIDWLCTLPEARQPHTMKAWCEEHGVSPNSATAWRRNPEFMAAWEERYRKVVGSPERAQEVMQSLYETAKDREDPRQVPAARAYLEAIDALKPKKVDVTVTKGSAADLTDAELQAALAEHVVREAERRARPPVLASDPSEMVD